MSETVPLWIDGKEVTTSTTFDVVSPTNSKKLWSSSSASNKEALQACEAAEKAFKSWRHVKPADVRAILLKAADIMESSREELVKYMMEETGALHGFADHNIGVSIDNCRNVAGLPANITGVIPQTQDPNQTAFVYKEPYGVILGIAPWNAPFILGCRAFLFPIAAGNTVVFKGSELAPKTFWGIGRCFKEAGLPDGVLNMIYHQSSDAAEVTNTLIEQPAIKKINFTGSTLVGSIIASKAGKELKPVLMELGGKNNAIVCEDANIPNAALQVALGSFLHAGQICMATERVLVHRTIIDSFATALKAATAKVYDPQADDPVLVAKAGAQKNYQLRQDAISKGAKVVYGDGNAADNSANHRIQPLIVQEATKDMDIWYTESFGPTLSLIPIDSDEEAIEIANDTEYGLSGAVFTANMGRGMKIAKAINSGAIHINSMTIHDEPTLPHGGVNKSGWGRFNGHWGIDEFMRLKTVTYTEV